MGNRKLIKLIPILILGFFIINFNTVFAYEIETHAYLTNEVVKFYNQNFPDNKIPDEFKNYLLNGSRREDDIPRWMNHFYDPVKDRGLTRDPAIDPLYALGAWQKSKDWAQDSTNQISALYNPVLNSTLAAFYAATNPEKLKETDFSWQRAITDYVNGDQERAFYALGHILHLLEDKTVPDHTRNDPHLHGSPYEIFAEKYNLNAPDKNLNNQLADKKIYNLLGLEDYFKELANYSNNNFYSKDTIGIQSGYNLPQPDYIQKDGDYFYGFKTSKEGDNYRIFIKEKQSLFNTVISNTENITLLLNKEGGDKVMSDYWSRLSTKSVQYGAGVVNLFFQEVEKAKNDPNFATTEEKSLLGKAIDSTKFFFAQVGSTVGNFFSGIFGTNQDFQPAGQVSLNNSQSQDSSSTLGDQEPNTKIQSQEVQPPKINNQSAALINQIQEEADQEIIQTITDNQKQIQQAISTQLTTNNPQPTTFKECSFATLQSPSRQKIIVNEVAWMGGSSDFGLTSTDEWIELKNISNAEVDISNWQLIDKAEQIKINLGSLPKTKVAAGGFILLERTNDNSAPNVPADLIYSNTLNNSDEGLRLFDNQCNLIDEVFADPNWPAGDNDQKRTMERSLDLSWHTYNGIAQNNIFGTPKKENSQPTIISSGGGGGGSNVSTNNQQQTTTSTLTNSPEKILISEVQITGGSGKTENDFVELYNPNNFQVNLNGYRLVKRTKTGTSDTGIKSWTNDVYIPANGYYLWANSGYTDIPATPDITTTAAISSDNGIAIRFGAADTGTIIDSAAWGETQNAFIEGSIFPTNPTTNQSIQRKFQNNTFVDTNNNSNDFEIQSCPSPKAPSKTCQQANQAPSAFFVYSPLNPQIGDLIAFDAASSTDPDGQIISCQWDFGDNATSSVSTATTTHTYSQAGNYSVNLIIFDNQNASSTATSTIISIDSPASQLSETNHIVISEIYPDKTDNNFDFVELYNPTNSSVTLGDYSLKILKEEAASTTSLASFSTSNTIAAKSFFLIGLGSYNSTSTRADTSRTSNLLTTKTATIILYDNNNSVDEFNYNPANIANGQSIERKSFSGGVCVSAQNDNEFLGNGCDTDSAADFEIRDTPNPQNSSSLPEPRSAPTVPENFSVQYSTSTMELIFNWQASQDYNKTSSTLTYKITDISNSSSTLTTIETASTTAKISINEIGRSYKFSIIAIDKESYQSGKSEVSIDIPQGLTIIAQQLDKLSFEKGTGNGDFYQLLGSGLTAEPKEVTFHANFTGQGAGYPGYAYYFNVTFWQSDKSDYSNPVNVSSNTCYRAGNYGALYGIPDGNCPNFGFELWIDKDYTIPIQNSFVFDPAKYYKMTFFAYQTNTYFYGSSDKNSYLYGKSTRDDGQGAEVDSSSVKDIYFIIPAESAFEVPLQTSQLTPQNFTLSYSSSTYEINFNWNKPRYLENSTSSLTYKITDTSAASSTLSNIETAATSTKISINEVGRNYKFSIQAFDESGAASLTDEKEIIIPHSLDEKFIIASQTDKTISEQGGTSSDVFYQTLGNDLSGKLGAVIFKVDFNPTHYINVDIYQSDNSDYSNSQIIYNVARCNFHSSYGEINCPDQIQITESNTIIVPAIKDFTFDPTKYYKLSFLTYQSASNFYGSDNESSYPNGQATKIVCCSYETQTSTVKDLYFILTSRTPLR